MSMQRLVVVDLDSFHLGLDVQRVIEVLAARPIVPCPGSPPAVAGLVNLRGQLASVIDPRSAFGMTPYDGTDAVHVVVRAGSATVVLEVDDERGLVDVVSENSFETPGHLPASLAAVVVCVHSLDHGLLLEVDIDGVFSSATRTAVSSGEGWSA